MEFQPKHKIGFCFLIKDQFCNQTIWEEFFKDVPHDEYKIYIHYKQKCPIKLQNYEFINSIPTEWGSISLVKATFLLFQRAVEDQCTIMFLLSGDTLPMQPYSAIKTIKETIFRPKYMNINKKDKMCLQNYNKLTPFMKSQFPLQSWRKQHMFFCITLQHFKIIQSKHNLIHYTKVRIPDEYYFINQCTFLNIPYKTDKYIYVGRSNQKTKAIDVTNAHFQENKENIQKFIFIRKITDYKQIPSYANFFNMQNITHCETA